MWKADTKGIHHGKEVELQNSAIKMFEGAKLDQGAEIRAFTYMMGQHQQWLFNLYNFHLPYKEYMFFFLLELKILSL